MGAVAAALGAWLARRGRTTGLGGTLVKNERDVANAVADELPDVVRRARKAGARGDLEYIGAGMTAIVLCDARGRGWKVGRRTDAHLRGMLQDEADWLATANRTRLG